MPSAGWPSMRNCFNWLEDSSNYSISVLQTNVSKNTSSIAGRGIKSQMLYVSQQSRLLRYGDHYIPCFLIVPPYIGLRWFYNPVIIFPIYLSIRISTLKHPKQNIWFNKWWNQSSMLSSTKTLLYDVFILQCSFLRLLSKMTHSFDCKTNRIVAGLLQLIEIITHAWSVSASS